MHHNNRKIIIKNVDKDKISDNITIVQDDIKAVYHELFDDALEKYNAKQTRKDRHIKDCNELSAIADMKKNFMR